MHELIPEAYRTQANANFPAPRTTFYNQEKAQNLVQLGDDWTPNAQPEKVQSVETKWAKDHTTYYVQTGDDWTPNAQPEKVQSVETKWAKDHTTYYAQTGEDMKWNANSQPEKVQSVETKWAKSHTTYYDKKNSLWRTGGSELAQLEDDSLVQWDANMGPEKVQELIPESYNTFSNAADNSVLSYPDIRTAFYVQTGDDWTPNAQPEKVQSVETKWAKDHTTYYMQTGEQGDWNANSQPEKVQSVETKWAKSHTTYYDKQNSLWRTGEELVQNESDGINNSHIDPWVYEVSSSAMSGIEHAAQKSSNDIAEPKMDKHVHGFANDNAEVLPWRRSEEAFVPNGSAARAQKSSNDIAEPKMEGNVHRFANDNAEVLPWPRSEKPFIANGSQNPAVNPSASLIQVEPINKAQKKSKDVGNKEIRADVYEVVNRIVSGIPSAPRTNEAPAYTFEPWNKPEPAAAAPAAAGAAATAPAAAAAPAAPALVQFDSANQLWRYI